MIVEYLIVGAALIAGGMVQRRLRAGMSPEERQQAGLGGGWSSVLGLVAIGLGIVLVVAGILGW